MGHLPNAGFEKHGEFGGVDRHQHVDDHGNYGQPRQKAEQEQYPASDFKGAVEWRKELGSDNPDPGEAPHSEFSRRTKLEHSFDEKYRSDWKPVEQGGYAWRMFVGDC